MRRSGVVAAAVMVLVSASTDAQSPAAAAPHFEVASIKPGLSPADAGRAAASSGGKFTFPFVGVRAQPGGRLIANTNLQGLILRAYGIRGYQIEGGPPWLTTDYFDIAAKAERESATEADMNEMLKSLLAERFGLRVHVETRQAPVHTLTVSRADGKLGPGLRRTSAECERLLEDTRRTGAALPTPSMPSGPQPRIEPVCGRTMGMVNTRTRTETYASGGRPFSEFVSSLSSNLNATVIDQTGLMGLFDVLLEFESTRQLANQPPPGLDPSSTDPLPVPLPAALQQQLGLKLDKATAPIAITIVDAAEQPSAN
jgi:uncharacterized protein (TIGR03435 family)